MVGLDGRNGFSTFTDSVILKAARIGDEETLDPAFIDTKKHPRFYPLQTKAWREKVVCQELQKVTSRDGG